jgi:hypothetical protein
MTTIAVLFVLGAFAVWKWGPRRRKEPGFDIVHVNQDGSVRELSPGEREHISREYQGGDGSRPYFKMSYESKNGWGSQSGFISRRKIPSRISIEQVNPDFDHAAKSLIFDLVSMSKEIGDEIVRNPDGSITCVPSRKMSRRERFKLARGYYLENQRRRESTARAQS